MRHHPCRTLVFLAFFSAAPAAHARAQVPSVDSTLLRELRQANAELLQAEQTGDTAAMRSLIAADFVWIRYDGARFGREARIGAVGRGRRTPATPSLLEEDARAVAPNVAIAHRRMRLLLGFGDQRRERTVWETRVYLRSGSRWVVAAQHATVVPDSAR